MADQASSVLLDCAHFSAGRCGSCRWLPVPLPQQLARKTEQAGALLSGSATGLVWDDPAVAPVSGFRNKAKVAVGGTSQEPTLGLVALDGSSTDLRDCALYEPALHRVLPILAEFIGIASLAPYRIVDRRGELKHLLVTVSPTGDLMVRFVLRSTEPESRIRKHLPGLLDRIPRLRVVSLNIQPEHKAVLEGEREIVLTEADLLQMPLRLPDRVLPLALRPQGFFQTNSAVATELYATAAAWTRDLSLTGIWDLYCGVGGFAMALAGPGREVIGVEVSAEAVAAGNATAPTGVTFIAGDATAYALTSTTTPDLVVVNPPRRGIGAELAGWIEASDIPQVLYSSCNAASLADDLARMGSLRPVRGRVLDMFPNTAHYEVLVMLDRGIG